MQEDAVRSLIFEEALRLHESLDASEIAARALKFLSGLVDAHSWAVFVKNEQTGRLELVRAIKETSPPVDPFVEIEQTRLPAARAVNEQKTVIAGGEYSSGVATTCDEVLAALCVPLVAKGRLVGVLPGLNQVRAGVGLHRQVRRR